MGLFHLFFFLLGAEKGGPAFAQCHPPSGGEVSFSVEMRVSGRKVLVPFTGFFHTEAHLTMDVREEEGVYRLTLKRPLSPPYTIQTVGSSAKEIHARVIAQSVEEAVAKGEKLLFSFRRDHPDLDREIPEKMHKPLPFVYEGSLKGKFGFVLAKEGRVLPGSVKNSISSKYAWPSDIFFHAFAYEGLAKALEILSSPALSMSGSRADNFEKTEGSAATILGEVSGTILPKVKEQFAFRQRASFPVRFSAGRDEEGITTLEGKASPGIELKEGLYLDSLSYVRRFCEEGRLLSISADMRLSGREGNGGFLRLSVVLQ